MNETLTYRIDSRILIDRYTAVMRAELAPAQVPRWLADAYRTVAGYLAGAGVEPAGPPFSRLTFLGDVIAVEAGFPVPGEIAGDGVVEPSALPDGPAVVTTHWGRYEDVAGAYQACLDWLHERDREPAGPHWEVYHTNPETEPDPARWRTDVVVPYRQRRHVATEHAG